MNKKIDDNMFKIITSWGIPDIEELRNKKLKFVFNSDEISNVGECYKDLRCEEKEVKYCIYDYENEKIIFSMEFFEGNYRIQLLRNNPPHIKLELLNVNDYELRKKGIASYYIRKLQEYAIKKKYSYIEVNPCPNADIFKEDNKKNSLSKKKLIKFYKGKSIEQMPIIVKWKYLYNNTVLFKKWIYGIFYVAILRKCEVRRG